MQDSFILWASYKMQVIITETWIQLKVENRYIVTNDLSMIEFFFYVFQFNRWNW